MKWLLLLSLLLSGVVHASEVLNIYIWADDIPAEVIHQFEKDTGIKVNIAEYDSNETMYAKIKAARSSRYDIILPSSYYVERMAREGMLEPLDTKRLSNYGNLNAQFIKPAYDPNIPHSIPYLWGVTGIFANRQYFDPEAISSWNDLWRPEYKGQLLLLDDAREVFSMALLALGYSPNDTDSAHIKQAFDKLAALKPNVRVFAVEAAPSIINDADATVGMVWNGDVYQIHDENANIDFIYPKDGFVIWSDDLAILKNAPHKANAYKFLNYLLRADVAAKCSEYQGYATANLAGQHVLPKDMQNNPTIFPPASTLKHGQFQRDVGDEVLAVYDRYWQQLKLL
ncbi:MAG: spermidine/putrescine ABC transporter substrate-binding protein [Legionellales bacterium]|nr:spermidine/putrescine ABC transporter substrate-binding protein [Legionellales bacterium]|tara:strand:+ start:22630 stop:23652 length:1023 start_codon:yes stop_codon:yes gene_type:complete